MTQEMEVKQSRSRRCDCCVEPWKNASVCALIVVLITKLAEANAMTRNAIYVKKSTRPSSAFWNENNYWYVCDVLKLSSF